MTAVLAGVGGLIVGAGVALGAVWISTVRDFQDWW